MKCAKEDLLLYAVTDRHWLNGRTLYEVVKESLDEMCIRDRYWCYGRTLKKRRYPVRFQMLW